MKFGGEFYHLKRRPGYPSTVEAVAIARLVFDREDLCLYFDRPPGSQWVASLWIVDGSCDADSAQKLKKSSGPLSSLRPSTSGGKTSSTNSSRGRWRSWILPILRRPPRRFPRRMRTGIAGLESKGAAVAV